MRKSKELDITWEHCSRVDPNNRNKVKCKYCKKVYFGGVNRMKNHLDEPTRLLFLNLLKGLKEEKRKKNDHDDECYEIDSLDRTLKSYVKEVRAKQISMDQALKNREPVVSALCRLLYGEALPLNLVKSDALRLVGEYGEGLILPSYHEARVSYLKKEVDRVEKGLDKYKEEWKKTGCTIMSDVWTDGKQRSITNFLVNSPSGTVFVKSIDTSSFAKDAKKLFEMLNAVVEEVGEKNVVQVITDSASAYVLAGSMLENARPHLFWNPCSAHILDLILQDIGEGKTFKDTIDKAKKVTVFIYQHSVLLSMFRKFTGDKESGSYKICYLFSYFEKDA